MTARAHIAFLAVAGAATFVGMILWGRWGALIWMSDFIAWCG